MKDKNYKTKAKRKKRIGALKDKTIKIKLNCLENYLEGLEELNESQINHHPSYYDKQKQKIKEENYQKNLEKRCNLILEIAHNPALIGLPKKSRIIRPAEILSEEKEMDKIDLLLEFQDIFYLISLKQKDSKSSRRRTKKSLLKINNFLVYDYGLNNLKLLYVRENFKTDELRENKFTPFNYAPNQ